MVDEAFERACRIRDSLVAALLGHSGILGDVARRLARLGGEDMPLVIQRLRGGLPRERAFIGNPSQPAVVLSTVDQVGSRLLFRGYGVSEFMRPIHAALVGIDSLIVLDEAHLSRSFAQTLEWVQRYHDKAWAAESIGWPTTVVQMTATPSAGGEPFQLQGEDWNHPVLSKRIKCSKPTELLVVKGNPDEPHKAKQALAEVLSTEAQQLMACLGEAIPAPVVGVIANRVAIARSVFETLSDDKEAEAILLTGRIRPAERDELVEAYLPRVKAGRADVTNKYPLYVVATQTVEVGADLDFDGLVTECAPLDALRQRFGRLNRLGRRENAPAVIAYLDLGKTSDLVYGDALRATWKDWLDKNAKGGRGQNRKRIDLGIQAISEFLPKGDDLNAFLTPSSPAPVLMPAHLDMLAQTSPSPAVAPDIALYLHGVEAQPEDVQLIWRADLPEPLTPKIAEQAMDTVSALPPAQQETLAVPVWAARVFLHGRGDVDLPDVEGAGHASEGSSRTIRYALRWRGESGSHVVAPDQIRPGDTLIVPASYGGMDAFGWLPQSGNPVPDIGDTAAHTQRGVALVRIHPSLIPQWFSGDDASVHVTHAVQTLNEVLSRFADGEDLSILCDELLARLLSLEGVRPEVQTVLQVLTTNRREISYPSDAAQGILLRELSNRRQEFTDDDDASSLTREVLLGEHCAGVGERARDYAMRCGLPAGLANDIALAGRLHDLGKADPRFQAWLRGGDRLAARKDGRLLAKSGRLANNDCLAIRLSRIQAGYPQGGRHECYSVAMTLANPRLLDGVNDDDLALYLVGAHHGRGRPFMPAVEDHGIPSISFPFDNKTVTFTGSHDQQLLHSGWTERFWALVHKYGYWGLAYLETLVRLADHRRSEEGH
ncbi:MAG: type I-G CRISPR-associated helicase/endonuclease Cas3g [Gammaproteobacteria bacterium]